jgi:hypothetical protein
MAIESDIGHPDARLHVTFYKRALEIVLTVSSRTVQLIFKLEIPHLYIFAHS